jgi:hypothetical protein
MSSKNLDKMINKERVAEKFERMFKRHVDEAHRDLRRARKAARLAVVEIRNARVVA